MYLLATEVSVNASILSVLNSIADFFAQLGNFVTTIIQRAWESFVDFLSFVSVVSEVPFIFIEYLWTPLGLSVGIVFSIAMVKFFLGVVL